MRLEVLARRAWTTTPRPELTAFDGDRLVGLAVHYTGSTRPLGDVPTLAATTRLLQGEYRLHTAPPPRGRGWKDIAYNAAIDQAGRVFDLRGIEHRSAANGDADVNASHAAVTFLLGVGDRPTPALLASFAAWRAHVWLKRWPEATRVVGHRDLSSTECPGDPTYQLIRSGRLAPPGEGEAMPAVTLTEEQFEDLVERTARRAAELITGIGAVHPVLVQDGTGAAELPDGRDIDAIPSVLGELQTDLGKVLAAVARIETRLAGRP